ATECGGRVEVTRVEDAEQRDAIDRAEPVERAQHGALRRNGPLRDRPGPHREATLRLELSQTAEELEQLRQPRVLATEPLSEALGEPLERAYGDLRRPHGPMPRRELRERQRPGVLRNVELRDPRRDERAQPLARGHGDHAGARGAIGRHPSRRRANHFGESPPLFGGEAVNPEVGAEHETRRQYSRGMQPEEAPDRTRDAARDLLRFIEASPSPYHAVAEVVARLSAGGFRAFDERESWELSPGTRGYVIRGGSVVAFVIGTRPAADAGFRLVGAHTDSPNLRVKPAARYESAGYVQLAVE